MDLNTRLGPANRRQLGEPTKEPIPVRHLAAPALLRLEMDNGEAAIWWNLQTRLRPGSLGRAPSALLLKPRALRDPRSALDRFLKLANAPAGQILAFSRPSDYSLSTTKAEFDR